MKIVSLNAWMGTVFEPLMAFVEAQAPTTDLFCFQEMMGAMEQGKEVTTAKGRRVNLFQEIEKRLPGFEARTMEMDQDYETDPAVQGRSWMGVTLFARKGIVFGPTKELSFGQNQHERSGAWLEHGGLCTLLTGDGMSLTICSLHGVAFPGNKLDSPQRLTQSQTILDAVKDAPGEVIIMGDFNLMPDTESIRMIERAGFQNLITDFKITTTRGSLHRQMHPEFGKPPFTWQEFADYAFVSPGVTVKQFTVPDEPISDHLPMILECEI